MGNPRTSQHRGSGNSASRSSNSGGRSGKSGGKQKSLLATLGVIAVGLVGSYFGIEGLGDNGSTTGSGSGAGTSTSAATSAVSTAHPGNKPAQSTQNSAPAPASWPQEGSSGLKTCSMDELPAEAEDTADDILAGGPYDYPQNDNKRFGNYEGVLPQESKNFYREYTVETPGINHRGAKRIVTGGGKKGDPDVWFYTDDHYESFCEITDAE